MRYLVFILCFSVYGQVTQINGLRITGIWPNNQGGIHVEWEADPGEGTTHGANDQWFIEYSQDKHFGDAPNKALRAWVTNDTLLLEYDIPPVGNGAWYVRIAFGWSINQLFDVTYHGSNTGWTPGYSVVINNSYNLPVFFPPSEVVTDEFIIVRFANSNNIIDYELQISKTREFLEYERIPIVNSDNGNKIIDLSLYRNTYVIHFRFRGVTNLGLITEWTYSQIEYRPEVIYKYYLPWVTNDTMININILNNAPTTNVSVGVLPKNTSSAFQPDIWYQSLVAYNSEIFLESANDLFPFDIQGRPLVFLSSEPISVNVYFNVFFGNVPVQMPFLLPEGSSSKWLIPSVIKNSRHLPAIVISNADSETYAVIDWRVEYEDSNGTRYPPKTGGGVIQPFENIIIDPGIDIDYTGYIIIENRTDTEISVLYSNRNELENGVIYGFQPALQIKGE